jgi:hypothetical protein
VVGAGTVHVEGCDFTVLRPVWLSVLLFLALPALYFLLAAWLTDWWLDRRSDLMRAGPRMVLPLLLLWLIPLPTLVVSAVVAVLWLAVQEVSRLTGTRWPTVRMVLRWAALAAMAALVAGSGIDLVRDIVALA